MRYHLSTQRLVAGSQIGPLDVEIRRLPKEAIEGGPRRCRPSGRPPLADVAAVIDPDVASRSSRAAAGRTSLPGSGARGGSPLPLRRPRRSGASPIPSARRRRRRHRGRASRAGRAGGRVASFRGGSAGNPARTGGTLRRRGRSSHPASPTAGRRQMKTKSASAWNARGLVRPGIAAGGSIPCAPCRPRRSTVV